MAGITLWTQTELPYESGFVIVTSAAEGSMVALHSRAPIVFSADDAATWLDPGTSGEQAAELARSASLRNDRFTWFEVSSTRWTGAGAGVGAIRLLTVKQLANSRWWA